MSGRGGEVGRYNTSLLGLLYLLLLVEINEFSWGLELGYDISCKKPIGDGQIQKEDEKQYARLQAWRWGCVFGCDAENNDGSV